MKTVIRALHTPVTKGRGAFSTLTALFICALLLIIGLALLGNGMSALNNANAEGVKAGALEAANAGLDSALDTLDASSTATNCSPGAVQGVAYLCGMSGSFTSNAPQSIVDPCTGASMTIDRGLEVVWGSAGISDGARGVCVEAVVSPPSIGVQMPDNAITAQRNIGGGGHVPIQTDPTDVLNPHDADIYANGNISGFTTLVEGNTYAAGSDSQPGYDGATHSGVPPVALPPGWEIIAFQDYIQSRAQEGTILSAAQFAAAGSVAYPGNVFVDGDVTLTKGTVRLGGAAVYFNGNVSLSGQASIVNYGGGVVMVAGSYAQTGNSGGYQVGTNPKGVLAVMGSPSDGSFATSISGNGSTKLGVVWTAFGSTQLAGNGSLSGMIVSGADVFFNGGGVTGAFTVDHRLANSRHPNAGQNPSARLCRTLRLANADASGVFTSDHSYESKPQ